MKQTAREISKSPEAQREAEQAGIGTQIRDLIRQVEKEKERDRGFDKERDLGLER